MSNKPTTVSSTTLTKKIYHLDLSGPIENDSMCYAEHLHVFRTATEVDEIHIHINSEGGSLYTAAQYINTMSMCAAPIEAHVEGICMSAATLIMLASSRWTIHPDTMVMFHNYSTGTYGTGDEGIEQGLAIKEFAGRLKDTYYRGFLTDEEIESIKGNNSTFWLTGKEAGERIQKYADYRQSEADLEREILNEERMIDIVPDLLNNEAARRAILQSLNYEISVAKEG